MEEILKIENGMEMEGLRDFDCVGFILRFQKLEISFSLENPRESVKCRLSRTDHLPTFHRSSDSRR